ncbi:MAG: DUF4350 domain-containing protein [Pyrinomonadaceae bacterium]
MKERFFVITGVLVLALILIGLNAATYVQRNQELDNEIFPNRSTFNYGATGTHAFYDLLQHTGFKVVRFQDPLEEIGSYDPEKFGTIVLMGSPKIPRTAAAYKALLNWVRFGGRVILIDREPDFQLLQPGNCKRFKVEDSLATENTFDQANVEFREVENTNENSSAEENNTNTSSKELLEVVSADPSDSVSMIGNSPAGTPIQPSVYTAGVFSVQPSKFASSAIITEFNPNCDAYYRGFSEDHPLEKESGFNNNSNAKFDYGYNDNTNAEIDNSNFESVPEGDSANVLTEEEIEDQEVETNVAETEEYTESEISYFPMVQISDGKKNLLITTNLGYGEIVWLTDPYIVANGGITLLDNSRLAYNLAGDQLFPIAFDEYSSGYGKNENLALEYFKGTPLIPIVLQLLFFVVLIFYSQSKRFGRPLPLAEPNRLSKLEYVSAMAQLQERARAYDIATENIYKEFKRRSSNIIGVDPNSISNDEFAGLLAERLNWKKAKVSEVIEGCEDIIYGSTAKSSDVVRLTAQLREMEKLLGINRRKKKQ